MIIPTHWYDLEILYSKLDIDEDLESLVEDSYQEGYADGIENAEEDVCDQCGDLILGKEEQK